MKRFISLSLMIVIMTTCLLSQERKALIIGNASYQSMPLEWDFIVSP